MTDAKASYRQILRSTSLVGGATVASLVFGLARSKAIALLAGPAGIGLFGVLNALFTTGTTIAGLNLQSTGVRQMGATPAATLERARAETGLWLFAWLAAVVGSFAFWVFERFIYLPSAPELTAMPRFPWLAVAVGLSTLNGVQLVILQVHGRIASIALVRLVGSFLSAGLAISAVYLLGTTGLYVAIVATPLAAILVALACLRGVSRSSWQPAGRWILSEWRGLAVMGMGLTIAGLTGNASQLVLRSIIATKGGLIAAGLFQAAWTLTNVNLSIVLSAMAVDYFPRLTAVAQSPDRMREVLNQQLYVALLLAGPILTIAIGFAPFILKLFYSDSFTGASLVLQLQIAGDVMKLASWSLGYVLLALNATTGFVIAGITFDIMIVMIVWLLYPMLGLESTGIGYIVALVISLLTSIILVARHNIRIDKRNIIMMILLFLLLIVIIVTSVISPIFGVGMGVVAFAANLAFGWREVRAMDLALPSRLQRLLQPRAMHR